MEIADLVHTALARPDHIAIAAYDGTRAGAPGAPTTIDIRTPDALRRVMTHPGELGLVRAYVAGDLDLDGDVYDVLSLGMGDDAHAFHLDKQLALDVIRSAGLRNLRPLPPPPEEAHLHGRLHSKHRDAEAISHHYDVSNEFYRMVLGPAMTYSCAVWRSPDEDL